MGYVVGQKVYTVNNKTNQVDTWTYNLWIPGKDEPLIYLTRGKQYCFLPARCVFSSYYEASKLINK